MFESVGLIFITPSLTIDAWCFYLRSPW